MKRSDKDLNKLYKYALTMDVVDKVRNVVELFYG